MKKENIKMVTKMMPIKENKRKKLNKDISYLKKLFVKEFPDMEGNIKKGVYSVNILLWNDDDYRVEIFSSAIDENTNQKLKIILFKHKKSIYKEIYDITDYDVYTGNRKLLYYKKLDLGLKNEKRN